jgi:hypothetical protein
MNLRLDPALDARLGHAAVDESTTKAELIRQAVTDLLERHAAATREPAVSNLARTLRKAEDSLTDALVDEMDSPTPDPRLAGLHDAAKQAIIMLRELASVVESWENSECVNENVGHYASGEDFQIYD